GNQPLVVPSPLHVILKANLLDVGLQSHCSSKKTSWNTLKKNVSKKSSKDIQNSSAIRLSCKSGKRLRKRKRKRKRWKVKMETRRQRLKKKRKIMKKKRKKKRN